MYIHWKCCWSRIKLSNFAYTLKLQSIRVIQGPHIRAFIRPWRGWRWSGICRSTVHPKCTAAAATTTRLCLSPGTSHIYHSIMSHCLFGCSWFGTIPSHCLQWISPPSIYQTHCIHPDCSIPSGIGPLYHCQTSRRTIAKGGAVLRRRSQETVPIHIAHVLCGTFLGVQTAHDIHGSHRSRLRGDWILGLQQLWFRANDSHGEGICCGDSQK